MVVQQHWYLTTPEPCFGGWGWGNLFCTAFPCMLWTSCMKGQLAKPVAFHEIGIHATYVPSPLGCIVILSGICHFYKSESPLYIVYLVCLIEIYMEQEKKHDNITKQYIIWNELGVSFIFIVSEWTVVKGDCKSTIMLLFSNHLFVYVK